MEKFTPIFTSKIPIEIFLTRLTPTIFLSFILSVVTYYLVQIPLIRQKKYQPPNYLID